MVNPPRSCSTPEPTILLISPARAGPWTCGECRSFPVTSELTAPRWDSKRYLALTPEEEAMTKPGVREVRHVVR